MLSEAFLATVRAEDAKAEHHNVSEPTVSVWLCSLHCVIITTEAISVTMQSSLSQSSQVFFFPVQHELFTTPTEQQRKGFILILETCKINNLSISLAAKAAETCLHLEDGRGMLRGNKYPSVWIENRYKFGNKHIIVVQTTITSGAIAKHQVIAWAGRPWCTESFPLLHHISKQIRHNNVFA